MVVSHVPPTGDLAWNLGMGRDWELNREPFGSQASTQSTESHQPGHFKILFYLYILDSPFWASVRNYLWEGGKKVFYSLVENMLSFYMSTPACINLICLIELNKDIKVVIIREPWVVNKGESQWKSSSQLPKNVVPYHLHQNHLGDS